MVDEGGVKDKSEVTPVENDHFRTDKRILNFFLFWFILFFLVVMAGMIISGNLSSGFIISTILGSLIAAFFFTGFLAFKYHGKRGIIKTKRVFKWFTKISIIIGLTFACGMFFLLTQTSILGEPVESNILIMIAMFIGFFIGGIIAAFIGFIILFITGFGMIGVMSTLIRKKTPDLLVEITKISPNITETKKKENKKKYIG